MHAWPHRQCYSNMQIMIDFMYNQLIIFQKHTSNTLNENFKHNKPGNVFKMLTHWSYVFLALTHRNVLAGSFDHMVLMLSDRVHIVQPVSPTLKAIGQMDLQEFLFDMSFKTIMEPAWSADKIGTHKVNNLIINLIIKSDGTHKKWQTIVSNFTRWK